MADIKKVIELLIKVVGNADKDIKTVTSELTKFAKQIDKTTTLTKDFQSIVQNTGKYFADLGQKINASTSQMSTFDSKITASTLQVDSFGKKTDISAKNVDDLGKKTKDTNAQLDTLGNEVNEANTQLGKLETNTKETNTEFDELGNKTKTITTYLDSLGNKTKESVTDFDNLGKKSKVTTTSLDQLGNKTKETVSEFNELGQKTKTTVTNFDKLSKEAKDVSTQVDTLGNETRQATIQFDGFADEAKDTSTWLDKLQKIARTATTRIDNLGKEAITSYRQIGILGTKAKTSTASLDGMATALTGVIGQLSVMATTLASIAFPIAKAAEFQRQMSEVQALFGETDEVVARMTEKVREMGATTEFSATQAAEGMKYLGIAGLDAEQAMTALPQVLYLAQAGALELGQAADIATNIMTGFGLTSNDLERVVNVLAVTFTTTNSTLEELGTAMAYVAPVASGLGADFEDLAAALGLLHNAGIKGSMAGTTLRGVMVRLVTPTKDARRELQAISDQLGDTGLQLRDAEGDWIGFTELVEQFEQAGVTTTKVMEILGQRAGPGLAALLSQGSKAMREQVELNKQAEGRARAIADVMHKNVVGAYKALMSAVEELSIEIGNKFLPALEDTIKWINEVVLAVIDWTNLNPELTKQIAVITASLGGLLVVLTAISVASKLLLGRSVKWMGLLKLLLSPIGLLIGLLVALAAISLSDTVKQWVSDFEIFGLSIGEILSIVLASIIDTFERMIIYIHAKLTDLAAMPRMILGSIITYVALWGKMLVSTVAKIPGLGKLLGWDDDEAEIKKLLDDIEQKGREITNETIRNSEESKKAFENQHQMGKLMLAQINEEHTARTKLREAEEAYQAIREKEILLEKEIAKVTRAIQASRKEELEKLEKAQEDANKSWVAQEDALRNFVQEGNDLLATLGESIDTNVNKTWEAATDESIAQEYKALLEQLEKETEIYGTNNAAAMAKASKEITDAQISAVQGGIDEIDRLYDQQLIDFQELKQAELLSTELSAKDRLDAEEKYVKEVQEYSLDLLEKKKQYYEDATEALKLELKNAKDAEENAAKEIEKIQGRQDDLREDSEKRLRELRRKTMTEQELYADKQLEFEELISKAQAATGEERIKYAEQAEDIAADLVTTTRQGAVDITTAQEGMIEAQDLQNKGLEELKTISQEAQKSEVERIQSATTALEDMNTKLQTVRTELDKGLKAKVELDRQDFDNQVEQISKQKDIVVGAVVDLDKANAELAAWLAETKELVDQVVIPMKTEGYDEIKKDFELVEGAKEALAKDVLIQIEAGGKVDATTKVLGDLAGIKTELTKEEAIEIITGNKSKDTKTYLDNLKLTTDDLTKQKKTITVTEQVDTTKIDGLPDELSKLPSEQSPKVVPVTVDASEATKSVNSVKESIDSLPQDTSLSVGVEGAKEAAGETDELFNAINKLANKTVNVVVNDLGNAITQVDTLLTKLNSLPETKTITIRQEFVTTGENLAGQENITGARRGRRLSGFGGGDIIPALLEPGEWVIRKEAVKKYGNAFFSQLNAMRFALGGQVYSFDSARYQKIIKKRWEELGLGEFLEGDANVSDLYPEINKEANFLDVPLTSVTIGKPGAPKDLNRGFYGATGSETPDDKELELIIKKAASATGFSPSERYAYKRLEALANLKYMYEAKEAEEAAQTAAEEAAVEKAAADLEAQKAGEELAEFQQEQIAAIFEEAAQKSARRKEALIQESAMQFYDNNSAELRKLRIDKYFTQKIVPEDLYNVINESANILDTQLTNIGMAMQAGNATRQQRQIANLANIRKGPDDPDFGYYISEDDQIPDETELDYIMQRSMLPVDRGLFGSDEEDALGKLRNLLLLKNLYGFKLGGLVGNLTSTIGQVGNLFRTNGPRDIITPTMKRYQTGGSVENTSSIVKHQIDFNLGGQNYGPFEASRTTVNDFVTALATAKGRN